MRAALLLVLAVQGLVIRADAQPVIHVTPSEFIEGQPVQVDVTGLEPGQRIDLQASQFLAAYPAGEEIFRGSATFLADEHGRINTRIAQPLPGSSYDRPDPSGLFWSMRPHRSPGSSSSVNEPTDRSGPARGTVLLEARDSGRTIASAIARVGGAATDVEVREVRDLGVTGVWARNKAPERQPAIIFLGGSEGGLFTARWAAPLLASHGYSVLGLAYFQGEEPALAELPPNLELIPLERLSLARDWLSNQPGVDSSRIAVVGVSKGAEMALVASAYFPWVTAVGAFAPSHVVWEGVPAGDTDRSAGSSWTFEGRPLPFVRWSRAAEFRADRARASSGSSRLTEVHLESLVTYSGDIAAAFIPVERSRAAFFIAAGIDDGMWPAAFSAELIRQRLEERRPARPAIFEIHPTGHLVLGTGWAPTTQFQRSTGRLQGGNPRLDAAAQQIIWPAFLKFLEENLRTGN